MKLGESPLFQERCNAVLDFYGWWDANCTSPSPTERTIVAGGNKEGTTCLLIFKGSREDFMAVNNFIQNMGVVDAEI